MIGGRPICQICTRAGHTATIVSTDLKEMAKIDTKLLSSPWSINYGLHFRPSRSLHITGFSDADLGVNQDDDGPQAGMQSS